MVGLGLAGTVHVSLSVRILGIQSFTHKPDASLQGKGVTPGFVDWVAFGGSADRPTSILLAALCY